MKNIEELAAGIKDAFGEYDLNDDEVIDSLAEWVVNVGMKLDFEDSEYGYGLRMEWRNLNKSALTEFADAKAVELEAEGILFGLQLRGPGETGWLDVKPSQARFVLAWLSNQPE